MMSNNTTFNSSNPLAKADELQKFESSFFPAGGAPQLANIPQAPPAPTNLNNVKSKPMNLKTRNWGPKLENGYGGLNRSLYDRPNSWDSRPIMDERAHLNNNNVSSFPSSSTSTTSTSRSLSSSVPSAPAVNKKYFKNRHNNLIHGKRLRLHNWGNPTAEGWSGMNRDLYNRGLKLERDVFLNDLRFKYGPRPNFQQQERAITTDVSNIVETVPTYTTTTAATTTTALVETGPAKVLATTVPVPMLNPPINDGRRYAKLYKKNTNALGSDKGVSKLVKRRGTRRDHLVQPNVPAALTTLPLVAAPSTGALTVIQPATLVAETRSVLPVATTGILPVAGTPLAPTAGLTRADRRREKRVIKDQQRFAKKEERAARKANKNGVLPAPIISAPVLTAPPMSAMAPMHTATYLPPLQPTTTTTTLVGAPALPIAQPATFVGETRSVLTQEATLLAPVTTTGLTPTPIIGGVSARPLDHAHVLAGQLGNAPVKRPRRARKAKKGTEQPLYSNIISTTPAPLTATTIGSTAATTTSSIVEGTTTVVQPATLVSETRNIVVDPLVQQGMIKQEYNMAPAISPLATGNPIM